MSPSLADAPTVTPPPGACPGCGVALPDDAPAGLCPRCLLSGGLFSAASTGGGPRFAAPGLEELARRFPDLELRGTLGRGGMGAVYLARQVKLDRDVALKVLPPEVGRDPAFAHRFLREARTLARLNHPHIVQVFDFGQTPDENGEPGLFYFLMEYVDGANLRDVIAAASTGTVEPAKSLEIVRQVCDALQFAHARGVVHRDVKPENILLDKSGTVKIADFGLAKLGRGPGGEGRAEPAAHTLTATRQAMGTPHYMAPEQARGTRDVDHRADIYSLGVVFYELLTGELPMGRFAPPSVRARPESRVDARLDDVVLRALASDPADRYQSITDVRTAVDDLGLPADPATPAIGGLADAPHLAAPAPSESDGAAVPPAGNVRVTVTPPPPEREPPAGEPRADEPGPAVREVLDWQRRRRTVPIGVFAGATALLCGAGVMWAVNALCFEHGRGQPGLVAFGLMFAVVAAGFHIIFAADNAKFRSADPSLWMTHWDLGLIAGDLVRLHAWPLAAGWAAGAIFYGIGGSGPAVVLGTAVEVAAAGFALRLRDRPPCWWPAAWGWGDEPAPLPAGGPDRVPRRAGRRDRIINGVFGGVGGVLTVGGLLAACLAGPNLHGSEQAFVMLFGLAAALAGSGLTAACGAGELAHRAGDPASRRSRLRLVLRDLGWSLWLPIGVGLGAAFLSAILSARGETIVHVGVIFGVAALTLQTARRETPPVWWPGVWSWFGAPPLTPLPPATPPPAAAPPAEPPGGPATAPTGGEIPPPAAVERVVGPEPAPAGRVEEVRTHLGRLGRAAVAACGAAVAVGASLIAAGMLVAGWSDDPLALGCVLLIPAAFLRWVGGMLPAVRPTDAPAPWYERLTGDGTAAAPNGRRRDVDRDLWLVDTWDWLLATVWTAAAAFLAGGLVYAACVNDRTDPSNELVVIVAVAAGLLAAGWATLRRRTAPLWWPPGWGWKPVDAGPWAVAGSVAAAVGRWGVFRTPPGGLARPAVWAALWLLAPPCLAAVMFVGEPVRLRGGPTPAAYHLAVAVLVWPAFLVPLGVPLLAWAGVVQVRRSRERGDANPVRGRRLGVLCAWGVPAAVCVAAGMAAGFGALLAGAELRLVPGPRELSEWEEARMFLVFAATGGMLLGGPPAVWLWVTLSRASRGPGPAVPAPPSGPRDTGAGLSRAFAPKTKRDWTETIAATCAALVVLAVAGWWFLGPRPAPPREAGPQSEPVAAAPPAPPAAVPATPDETAAVAAFRNGTGPAFTVTAGPLGTGEVRWAPGVERFLGQSDGADAAAVLAAAAEVRRAWAGAVAAGATAEIDDRGNVAFTLPDLTAEAAAWEADFYEAADAALPDRALQRTLRRANPLFFGSMQVVGVRGGWQPAPVPLCPAGAGPIPTATPRYLEVERRGAWTRVRASPDTDPEVRKRNAVIEPLFDTGETDELPGPLRFLVPAADRVRAGEPPFPTASETEAP